MSNIKRQNVYLLCLSYLLAGACLGGLEFAVSIIKSQNHNTAPFIAGLISASILACFGLVVGIMTLLFQKTNNYNKGLQLVISCCLLFLSSRNLALELSALVIGASLVIAFTAQLLKKQTLLTTWNLALCFIFLASPMFAGKSLELVFSKAQISLIFSCALFPLLLISSLCLPRRESAGATKTTETLKAICALALALCLSWISSVFMVRLWGFRTMENLQLLVVGVEVLLIGYVLQHFFGRSASSAKQRTVSFFSLAILAIATFLFTTIGFREAKVRSYTLKSLPHTGLALSYFVSSFDFDHDGYSSILSSGDCNDNNAKISPNGIDLPGDHVDSNCLNGDLQSIEFPYFNIPIEVTPPQQIARKPKSVVFLLIDTLRADAVDYTLGNARTPILADIASKSLKFDRAYAQSNNTLESFPYIFHMGFRDLSRYHVPWTLANILHSANIPTEAILQSGVKEWWGDDLHKVFLGFDKTQQAPANIRAWSPTETARIASESIHAASGKSTFTFIHFESLHDYFSQVMEGGRMISQGLNLTEFLSMWNIRATAAEKKAKYLEVLSEVDSALSKVWQAVIELEKTNDVLFVVCADHGEEFFEHGGLFHMGTLYEELVRVPLIVYNSSLNKREEPNPVGLYRLTPTFLKFFGFSGKFLDEMNLTNPTTKPYEIFAQFTISDPVQKRNFMLLDGEQKLIYDAYDQLFELYDLKPDPGEQNNLAYDPASQKTLSDLRQKMDRLMFYMNYGDLELLKLREAASKQAASQPK